MTFGRLLTAMVTPFEDNGDISYSEYSLNIRSANTIKLEIGDTVFRHLIDGDIVYDNFI